MKLTRLLLSLPLKTLMSDFYRDTGMTPNDCMSAICYESFLFRKKAPHVGTSADFVKAIQIAISCKFYVGKTGDLTIRQLISAAPELYQNRLHSKIVTAIGDIGTHLPKMSTTAIQDGGIYFKKNPKLDSGITSGSLNADKSVAGSRNGSLENVYNFLGITYKIGTSDNMSIFEMLFNEKQSAIDLFYKLSGNDKTFVDCIISASQTQQARMPPSNISQFYKQNFIDYDGKRITVSPLPAVATINSLLGSLANLKNNGGRVGQTTYLIGGNNPNNAAALNRGTGGIPHFKAWIPPTSAVHRTKAAIYNNRNILKKMSLTTAMVDQIGLFIDSGNVDYAKLIASIINNIVSQLSDISNVINHDVNRIKNDYFEKHVNSIVRDYLTSITDSDQYNSSGDMAIEFIAKISAAIKRKKKVYLVENSDFVSATHVFISGLVPIENGAFL